MAYAQYNTIAATDYNTLGWGGTQGTYVYSPNNIAYVMGTGYGAWGYGQGLSLINTVSSTAVITATQWAGLFFLVNRGLGHQGSTQIAAGNLNATSGQTITYFSNVASAVTSLSTNANLAYATQGASTTTPGATTISFPDSVSAYASTITHTLSWANGDAARYFFNCGGYITCTISASNNNGTSRSADFVTNWGTNQAGFKIGRNAAQSSARTGSGGTVNTTNALGYWNLTTSAQTISQVTSSNSAYNYNTDYTYIQLQTNTTNNSGNGDNGYVITVTFYSHVNAQTNSNFNDAVSVNLTTAFNVYAPETTYLTTSWGTPTIA